MLPPPDVALAHYSDRQSLVIAGAEVAGQMWTEVNPNNIVESWTAQVPELTAVLSGAQLGAARSADPYLDEVAAWQELDPATASPVDPRAFAGTASDGRSLASLLMSPAFSALQGIASGLSTLQALSMGRQHLDTIARTQVADAGRLADGVSLAAHKSISGYVRVVVGKTCSRCMVLAGKHYKWNAGFKRHPHCDCIHLPSSVAKAGKLIQNPKHLYDSMSTRERQRAGWSIADQKAIGDGADLGQVTNAHRGTYEAGGRKYTTQGTTKHGLAGSRLKGQRRLTPEQIYAEARDRDEALRLLHEHGYLLNKPARVSRRSLALAADAPAPMAADLSKMTVPQLRAVAKERGIKIPAGSRKADIQGLLGGPSKAAAGSDLSKLTVPKLRELAKERGVAIPSRALKADIVAALDGATSADLTAHIAARAPRQLKAMVQAELERQAELVPAAFRSFRGVRVADEATWDEFASRGLIDTKHYAAYRPNDGQIFLSPRWSTDRAALDRRLRRAYEENDLAWSFPEYEFRGLDTAGGIVRHEFGHHVAQRFPRLEDAWTRAQREHLLHPLADELGVARPGDDLRAWFDSDAVKRAVRSKVSDYAAKSFDELLAELWAVNSGRGGKASPIARRIGTIMRDAWADGAKIPVKATKTAATKVPAKKAAAKKVATKPEDLTVAELLALAKEHGVPVPLGRNTKTDLIARLRMWEAGRDPILPGTAERRAAAVAASAAKAASEATAKAAADKAAAAALRSLPPSPRNPTVLTGRGGDKWWELIKDDTGLTPIHIRNLTLDGGSYPYTIASGSAYRVHGVVYVVEDGYAAKLTSDELVRGLWEVHQTLPPDGVHHQRGYAWLAGKNPADAYWARQYNKPDFTSAATAGGGGTHVWNRGSRSVDYVTPSGMAGTLRHEFGHNVSGGVHSHGMHDNGQLWGDAGQRDETTSRHVTIVSLRPAAAGHQITMTPDRSKGYPRGVTDYGQSSPAEDFAESMRLYLAGELGTARLRPGGPETPFYFRDVWPARAAHLDKLLPKVAAEQRKALASLGR